MWVCAVDEAGDGGVAGQVDDLGGSQDVGVAGAHALHAVTLDDNDGVLDQSPLPV